MSGTYLLLVSAGNTDELDPEQAIAISTPRAAAAEEEARIWSRPYLVV